MQTVEEEDLSAGQREALDKVLNEVVNVVVFHKETLDFAGNDIKRRHIPAFTEAVIKSFMNRFPEKVVEKDKDFAIIIVDMKTKNIAIQAIR